MQQKVPKQNQLKNQSKTNPKIKKSKSKKEGNPTVLEMFNFITKTKDANTTDGKTINKNENDVGVHSLDKKLNETKMHIDIDLESKHYNPTSNIETMTSEEEDIDTPSDDDEVSPGDDKEENEEQMEALNKESAKKNDAANTEEEKDVVITTVKENKLVFFQEMADKFTDPEIEYLGEVKSNNNQVYDKAFKLEKDENDTPKIANDTTIKDEYEEKFNKQEEKLNEQARQMETMKAQLAILLSNKNTTTSDEVASNESEELETNLSQLSDLSKLIDKTPVGTSVLPDTICLSGDELNDESQLSPSSRLQNISGIKRKMTENENLQKIIKITNANDEFYTPDLLNVHKLSSSEGESVETVTDEYDKGFEPKTPPPKKFKNLTKKTRDTLRKYPKEMHSHDVSNLLKMGGDPKPNGDTDIEIVESSDNDDTSPKIKRGKKIKEEISKNADTMESSETNFKPHKGGASSSLESRMRNLDHSPNYQSNKKPAGFQSNEFVDQNAHIDLPVDFWKEYPWADQFASICSPRDLDYFADLHNVKHLRDKIAPWFTTIKPLDPYDRRYFTIWIDDEQYVSRARACSKGNYFRSRQYPTEDECLVCGKLLITTFHCFMPVYKWQDPNTVNKIDVWKMKNSWLKVCYLHFRRSTGVELIPNRNPQYFGQPDTRRRKPQRTQQTLAPRALSFSDGNLEIPGEF